MRVMLFLKYLFIMCLGFCLFGCGKEESGYYEVKRLPEPVVPAAEPVHTDHDGHDHSVEAEVKHSATGFDYELPATWAQVPASSMVLASFQAGSPPEQIASVSVSAFPGDVGGQVANINRWRRQVGLGPVDPVAADGFIRAMEISGLNAWQVDFTGPSGTRLRVSAVSHLGKTWFFKLAGNTAVVERELEAYDAFIGSIELK